MLLMECVPIPLDLLHADVPQDTLVMDLTAKMLTNVSPTHVGITLYVLTDLGASHVNVLKGTLAELSHASTLMSVDRQAHVILRQLARTQLARSHVLVIQDILEMVKHVLISMNVKAVLVHAMFLQIVQTALDLTFVVVILDFKEMD